MLEIQVVSTEKHFTDLRHVLWIYGEWRNFDAALGDYQRELDTLESYYIYPKAVMLLAYWQGKPVGCVAFRRLSDEICEMKRMFVFPDHQGKKIGGSLIQEIVNQGKLAGYSIMRLDTHPRMHAAQHLYQKAGFTEIDRYNDNPTPGIRFFERVL